MNIGRVAVSALISVAALAAQSHTAQACSCAPGSVEQSFAGADAVFLGTVKSNEWPWGIYASGARVAVETVWKGEIPSAVYLVAGTHDSGSMTMNTCELEPQ